MIATSSRSPPTNDLRRAGLAQAADEPDLIVELRPEHIEKDRLQLQLLHRRAKALGKFAAIDGAVIDDGERFFAPQAR